MQKLLKRTAQAEKQVARRKAKRNDIKARAEEQREFIKRMGAVSEVNKALVAARKRRREDWDLGLLAPRRDTPIADDTGAYWGSISLRRTMSEIGERQRNLACQWAGGAKYLCVKVGDRVAIMQGPDKGKIGLVKAVLEEESMVTLDGIGAELQQNVTVSDYLREAGLLETNAYTQLMPLRVPIHAIRLVHPLQDEETGQVRDVIINELKPVNIVHDKPTKRTTWERVVPGLNVTIPWPHKFEEAERHALEQVFDEHECDTPDSEVQAQTYIPELLLPPMPAEIVDELRNKYSKFRTRHEPEYIARKEAEAFAKSAAGKQLQLQTMQTPLQEFNAKRKAERDAAAPVELSDAMLQKLGELMYNAQQERDFGVKLGVKADVKTPEEEAKAAEELAARIKKLESRLAWMPKRKRATDAPRLKGKLKDLRARAGMVPTAKASVPVSLTKASIPGSSAEESVSDFTPAPQSTPEEKATPPS